MSGMLLVFYQYFGILLKRDPKEADEYEFHTDIAYCRDKEHIKM